MREFTPGPWTVKFHPFNDGTPYFRISAGVPYTNHEDMGFSLAAIMREPDARLIAAAPEMYEALELLLSLPIALEELKHLHRGVGTKTANRAWLLAESALAKSRREVPNA